MAFVSLSHDSHSAVRASSSRRWRSGSHHQHESLRLDAAICKLEPMSWTTIPTTRPCRAAHRRIKSGVRLACSRNARRTCFVWRGLPDYLPGARCRRRSGQTSDPCRHLACRPAGVLQWPADPSRRRFLDCFWKQGLKAYAGPRRFIVSGADLLGYGTGSLVYSRSGKGSQDACNTYCMKLRHGKRRVWLVKATMSGLGHAVG